MNLQEIIVFLAAALFILYGLSFSLAPTIMLDLVTGGELEGTTAIVDFRSTYGGMTFGIGLVILYLYSINLVRASLVVIILVLLCMAATRTLGFIFDGSTNLLMYLFLALEVCGSLLAWVATRHTKNPASPHVAPQN